MLSKSAFIKAFAMLSLVWAWNTCPVFGADWKTLPGHIPRVTSRLASSGDLPSTNQLRLAIGLTLRDPAGLDKFLAEVADPTSPNFRHYLTTEEFTARFGPTEADYAAVKQFALLNGLSIRATHGNRLLLDVVGDVADVQRAFNLRLKKFQHPREGRQFFAPDSEPMVEKTLPIADVSGLSDYAQPHTKLKHAKASTISAKATTKLGSGPGGSFIGPDFRAAYAAGTTLTGAGQMVGLLQFDGFYSNDIVAYENLLPGQPRVPIQTVLLDGFNGKPTTGQNSGNDEVSLDIEMAIAMAPGLAKVVVFEAPTSGQPNDILNSMAANSAVKNLSCSWGWSGNQNATMENIFKQMVAQGQSFFNASGDSGAFTPGELDDPNQQTSPSASPNITQVGGTTLTMNGSGASYFSETVWNDGSGTGSGGGISLINPLPVWQKGIDMTANHGSTAGRNVPDVAMIGDNAFAYYGNGNSGAFMGTSISAPLWAGFMALVNQQASLIGNPPAGLINPAVYTLCESADYNLYFHDTTSGDNFWPSSPNDFPATVGYDLCTGWGTPNGTNLINALAAYNPSAHLVDSSRPTLTITNPTNNLKWSNLVFTISGTAHDNVAVSNVFYSLNGSDWMLPTPSNNWTNWSDIVLLTPGTNVVQAYAQDTSGNYSITSKVSFVCILSAPLTIHTNGRGSIGPAFNGALLQIGAKYTLTATAAAGFKFINWTDQDDQVVTNSAALMFAMASNLVFTANFVDATKPTNTITFPLVNQRWSNSTISVTGRAFDNVGIENVFYSLNGSDWQGVDFLSNGTNWSAGITPRPGTNIFRSYATDAAGNISTTNGLSFIYVVSAPLTLSTNGRGTISPNYNGVLLQLGVNYTLTATASAGFRFVNWTGNDNLVVTNSVTLTFTMVPNLAFTANFVDISKPTNTITLPIAGQHWSNSTLTVVGKATDNVGVNTVFYSLNSNEWQPASLFNNFTNWSAEVTLLPGTNFIQSYAVDNAGNFSATNKTAFVYVVSGTLTVNTNGRGAVSPNYNGALLQIGVNYTQTATATTGSKFIYWTDGDGRVVTTNVALKFLMASNLVFTANFIDVTKPTLTITKPLNNQFVSNYSLTITGKASDNVGVAGVFYSLNGSDWSNPSSASSYSNWTAQVNLTPGTNTILACAVDAAGNVSVTNKVTFVYVFPLGGIWNMVQFQTPAQMGWTPDSGLSAGSSFGEIAGAIQFYPDGTLTGSFEDAFTGTYVLNTNRVITTAIVTAGITNYFNLSVNASWDTMTLLNEQLDDQNNLQELIIFERAPVTNTLAGMAGSWSGIQFETPAQVTLDEVSGLQGGNSFSATNGSLNLNANGSASGNLGGAFTGSFSVGSNGVINLITIAGGETNAHTCFVNAGKNLLSLVERQLDANNNGQQLTLFQRVPVSVLPSDLIGTWNINELQTPNQLAWDAVNGLANGTTFAAVTGNIKFNSLGMISGNLNGSFTGIYRMVSSSALTLRLNYGAQTKTYTLFINASKDAMSSVSLDQKSQQLLLLQRN